MTQVIVLAKSSEVSTFVQLTWDLPNKETYLVFAFSRKYAFMSGWIIHSANVQLDPGKLSGLTLSRRKTGSFSLSLLCILHRGFYLILLLDVPGPPFPLLQVLSFPGPLLLWLNILHHPEGAVTLLVRAVHQ